MYDEFAPYWFLLGLLLFSMFVADVEQCSMFLVLSFGIMLLWVISTFIITWILVILYYLIKENGWVSMKVLERNVKYTVLI